MEFLLFIIIGILLFMFVFGGSNTSNKEKMAMINNLELKFNEILDELKKINSHLRNLNEKS